MNNIQAQNNPHINIYDRVLHIGAGLGASGSFYETLEYSQLVLVEASTELVELLSKKFFRNKAVRIINRVISAKEKQVDLNCYTNPRFDSQLELGENFLRSSNIRLKNRECLEALTFDALIADISLDREKANLLIIELNGYEVQFLTALEFDQLNMFDSIIVGLLNTNRYLNQSSEEDLLSALEKNGYLLREIKDGQYHFKKDKNLARLLIEHAGIIQRLTRERDEQIQRAASLQRQLESQSIEIQTLTKERDEQAGWHQETRKWAESLQKQMEEAKKLQSERERSQDLALKLQAKARIDLDNLRAQFQQKCINEQNLIELVRELQVKLQAAANYYHQLQVLHPEITGDKGGNLERKQGDTISIPEATVDGEIVKERKKSREKSKNANS